MSKSSISFCHFMGFFFFTDSNSIISGCRFRDAPNNQRIANAFPWVDLISSGT
ncbi:hypothetical protein Mapa_018333 [Marchantia paleacea]|nr:hypothetical protein Mapa_018333 [Marchantia paleacea]